MIKEKMQYQDSKPSLTKTVNLCKKLYGLSKKQSSFFDLFNETVDVAIIKESSANEINEFLKKNFPELKQNQATLLLNEISNY